jgi:hypothetical protein
MSEIELLMAPEPNAASAAVVIDVVGPDDGPGEFLNEVVLLVCTLRRADHPDGVRPIPVTDASELLGDSIQGLTPIRLAEGVGDSSPVAILRSALPANERPGQAIRMVHKIKPESAFDAETLLIHAVLLRPPHPDDLASADPQMDGTADAAVRTDGLSLSLRSKGRLRGQRSGGAVLHAFPAVLALG